MSLEISKVRGILNFPIIVNIKDEPNRILLVDDSYNAMEINKSTGKISNYGQIKQIDDINLYEIWPVGSSLKFYQEYEIE